MIQSQIFSISLPSKFKSFRQREMFFFFNMIYCDKNFVFLSCQISFPVTLHWYKVLSIMEQVVRLEKYIKIHFCIYMQIVDMKEIEGKFQGYHLFLCNVTNIKFTNTNGVAFPHFRISRVLLLHYTCAFHFVV